MAKKMLLKNAAELVTCRGVAPKIGAAMADIGVIPDGAMWIEDGVIRRVGTTAEIMESLDEEPDEVVDAAGRCVLPGFVDPHTHFLFGGYRAEEFSWRLRGDTYMQIMERGGGIVNTVQATRTSTTEELLEVGWKRLSSMLSFGVTTVEGKSGYGLDAATEIKQLEVMAQLGREHVVEVVPTFMGAHAVPAEYKGRTDEFVEYLLQSVLPVVAQRKLAEFCDVFCEKGVFSVEQSRRLLMAAQGLGMKAKVHADEIVSFGGAELAAELGAVSAEHLLHASDEGIHRMGEAGVIAVLLPATAFCLREPYARARFMIDHGVPVALATDFNPGSCFTESIPLVIALAALYMQMTPAEIVTALTINAAAAVGRADRIGSLEVGKQADFIVLEHPSHLYLPYHAGVNCVATVVKRGQVVNDRGLL
ncbi:MAG TPA: imidazolonepropionase [Negativicutes bacterium]|nr:imidazolonepropionase [Negativicutes bacterium]